MDNGGGGGARGQRWRFGPNEVLAGSANVSIRGVLNMVMANIQEGGPRPVIPLGHGDPSVFPCFRTTPAAEDAIVSAVRSAKYNCYAPTNGLLPARCAVAEYLSGDLPYKLSPDDIFLTGGCTQAIEVIISVLARPGANILLPRPGFPFYESRCAFSGLEVRHFNLVPERSWEVDLESVEALADENTVAMVVINPGNPCGNVNTYQHLAKVAETASKLGIMIIADEVYDHLAFGKNPFVPMGVFGKIVPVVTLGSISKRWVVPGWRLGWIAMIDPNGVLKETKVSPSDGRARCSAFLVSRATLGSISSNNKIYHFNIADGILNFLNLSSDPATFIQGAIPHILEFTKDDFFNKIIDVLRQTADICYEKIGEIECITCPHKPEGSMFVMVKLNLSHLEDVNDDVDFCNKLAKEESVIIAPGSALGMKNWLRVTFAIDPSSLEDGLDRLKSFCQRHAKQIK